MDRFQFEFADFRQVVIGLLCTLIVIVVPTETWACGTSLNETCSDAVIITEGSNCFTDCTENANEGNFDRDAVQNLICEGSPFGTIWYAIDSKSVNRYADILISSDEIDRVLLTVYIGDCNNLQFVSCNSGQLGNTELQSFRLLQNENYFFAISSTDGTEGEFEICVDLEDAAVQCNVNSQIELINTSKGSNLSGPYQPGESIEFCFEVNGYNDSSCSYLQAIIPLFGSGWDSSSFDRNGMPLNVTQELVTQGHTSFSTQDPICEGDPAGEWLWYEEGIVKYNLNSQNTFGLKNGDNIPSGWVFLSSFDPSCFFFDDACCTNPTDDPNLGFGDDDYPLCGFGMTQAWKICMELRTKSQNICAEDYDCTIGFKTLSGGEIGALVNRSCADDKIDYKNAIVNCCVAPELFTISDVIEVCLDQELEIEIESDDPNSSFIWFTDFDEEIRTHNESNLLIKNTFDELGTFYYEVYSTNGCVSEPLVIQIEVTETISAIVFQEPEIACIGDQVTLSVFFEGNENPDNFTYLWNDEEDTQELSFIVEEQDVEVDVNILKGSCSLALNKIIETYEQSEITLQEGAVICNGESYNLALEMTGPQPWEVKLESEFGEEIQVNLTDDFYLQEVFPLASDTYIITSAIDGNGCEAIISGSAEIIVSEDPKVFAGEDITINCSGDPVRLIGSMLNVIPTYESKWLNIDGEELEMENEMEAFANSPGDYILKIIDMESGCVGADTISVLEGSKGIGLEIEEGDAIEIFEGEQINLNAITELTDDEIEIIEWDHDGTLECSDCLSVDVMPLRDVTYTIYVTDVFGCTESRSVNVKIVSASEKLYIPNILSTTLGDENGVFRIYDDNNVLIISDLKIYSRWGALVFSATDFLPNDEIGHWKGRYNGKMAENGVYIYHLVIEMRGGKQERITGSITVAN